MKKINEMIEMFGLKKVEVDGEVGIQVTKMKNFINSKDIEFLKNNKLEIIAELEKIEANKIRVAERKKEMKIEELEKILNEWEKYNYNFQNRIYKENPSTAKITAPQITIKKATELYPEATAYLKAENYANSSNINKCTAGKKAIQRIINGDDYNKVITEMEEEWKQSQENNMWN